MMLLCLLSGSPGNLLTREFLVKQIWNDYGGGDEALTQSISILRKSLHDHQKKLIETVPKKGYILHALVTDVETVKQREAVKPFSKQPTSWLIGLMAVVIVALSVFIIIPANQDKVDKEEDNQPEVTKEQPVAIRNEPEHSKNSSPPPGGKDDARR